MSKWKLDIARILDDSIQLFLLQFLSSFLLIVLLFYIPVIITIRIISTFDITQ